MIGSARHHGFSLTETLLAVGTLAIGLTFIAGTFLAGIFFSTLSTERTIASVAVDEAFAKVRLFGLDPNGAGLRTDGFVPYEQLAPGVPAWEYLYPSTPQETERQYSWAALCRQMGTDSPLVQCTVFISRQTGTNSTYRVRKVGSLDLEPADWPHPVRVNIVQAANPADVNMVSIRDAVPSDAVDERAFVCDGAVLVDDSTGRVYHVLTRSAVNLDTMELDRPWMGGPDGWAWVVPPAVSGGRNPVVAVYQEVIRLPDR